MCIPAGNDYYFLNDRLDVKYDFILEDEGWFNEIMLYHHDFIRPSSDMRRFVITNQIKCAC